MRLSDHGTEGSPLLPTPSRLRIYLSAPGPAPIRPSERGLFGPCAVARPVTENPLGTDVQFRARTDNATSMSAPICLAGAPGRLVSPAEEASARPVF